MDNSYINPNQSGTGFTDPQVILQQTKLNNTHEQSIIKENNRHEQEMLNLKVNHEKEIKDKDLGLVGRLFGGHDITALNISGILLLLLVIIGVIFTFKLICLPKDSQSISIVDLWGIITPLITLILGYIFGNKNNNAS